MSRSGRSLRTNRSVTPAANPTPSLGPSISHPRLEPTPSGDVVPRRASTRTSPRRNTTSSSVPPPPGTQPPPEVQDARNNAYGTTGKADLGTKGNPAKAPIDFGDLLGSARRDYADGQQQQQQQLSQPQSQSQPQPQPDFQTMAEVLANSIERSPSRKRVSSSQTSATTSATALTVAKGNARAPATAADLSTIEEDNEVDSDDVLSVASSTRRRWLHGNGSASRPHTQDANTTTFLGNSFNYDNPTGTARRVAPLPSNAQSRRAPVRVSQASRAPPLRPFTPALNRQSWTTKSLWLAVVALISFLSVVGLQVFTSVPAVAHPSDIATTLALHEVGDEAWYKLGTWFPESMKITSGKFVFSNVLSERVQKLEDEVRILNNANSLTKGAIANLEKVLPTALAVHYKQGEYVIPETFWRAIKEKLDIHYDFTPKWDEFLRANTVEISRYVQDITQTDVERRFAEKAVVTKADFIKILSEKFEALSEDYKRRYMEIDYKYDTFVSRVGKEAADGARTDIQKVIDQLPKTQISALASYNLEKNADTALKQINFFSPSLGAVIDPYLTSPTMMPERTLLQSVYFAFNSHYPNPPITALEPWTEPGECWCAAPPPSRSTSARIPSIRDEPKAQLAVILPKEIYPTHVTVEHIPRSGTLDRAAAPREMELWIDAGSSYTDLSGAASLVYGSRAPVALPAEDLGVPAGYVLIGRWTYDWEATERAGGNHVQTFAVDVNTVEGRFSTRKVLLRARSNFGGGYTCLYRVRLHGKVAGG